MRSARGFIWLIVSLAALGAGATAVSQFVLMQEGQRFAEAVPMDNAFRIWAAFGVMFACASVVAGLFAMREIVGPVERLGAELARLIEDESEPTPTPRTRLREIGAIEDAVRGLRANARRRSLLQKERLALHSRLSEAHRQLRHDLSAAALVQREISPRDGAIGGYRLWARRIPSKYVAGDTYDIVERAGGGATVFVIDVAGHGAAAALASVAAHYTAMQVLRTRAADETLAKLAVRINAEWMHDLPYFTMLLVDLDPSTGRATMVQAGHPPPFVIRDGKPVVLDGPGGLPIGVLGEVDFAPRSFDLRPGDRLVLLTDGVHEFATQDGDGQPEADLVSALENAARHGGRDMIDSFVDTLAAPNGSAAFEDDVTVILVEGETSHEDVGMAIGADNRLADRGVTA